MREYGGIRVSENPYSRIFYAVRGVVMTLSNISDGAYIELMKKKY